jgi:hypothetical protein
MKQISLCDFHRFLRKGCADKSFAQLVVVISNESEKNLNRD